jgi:hypothetical protein
MVLYGIAFYMMVSDDAGMRDGFGLYRMGWDGTAWDGMLW